MRVCACVSNTERVWRVLCVGCCILVCLRNVSSFNLQKYGTDFWENIPRKHRHRVFSSRALLRCNPNSISSFSPVMIFSITWEMSVVRPQQPRSVYVCCRLFDHSPKRLLFGTQFYSKRCSFSFSLSLNNSKNSYFFVCEKAVLLLSWKPLTLLTPPIMMPNVWW